MVRFCHTLIICIVFLVPVGCSKKTKPPAPQEAASLGLMAAVPDNVLAFVATSSSDNLKPSFQKSTMGRIWNDPELQALIETATEQLITKAKQKIKDVNGAPDPAVLLDFLKLASNSSIIAGAASKQTEDGPPLYGFVILDAGGQKTKIAAALTELETAAKEGDIIELEVASFKMHGPADNRGVPGYWGWVQNYLVFAINDPDGLALKHLQDPRTAAPDNLKQVPTVDDVFAAYADCQKLADVVKIVADRESATDKLAVIAAVVEKLGLKNVGVATAAARFEGPDWLLTESIEVPQPRTGMFASLKPIDLKMFDMVDARALLAGAANCSIATIYDTIMDVIKEAAPPKVAAQIDKKIAEIQSKINVDIRKDLLANLTGPVVFYSIPAGAVMEAPGGGAVAIAQIKDAKMIEKTLTALAEFATAAAGDAVSLSSQPQPDGKTLHTCVIAPLAPMQVMPCWMMLDDHIVIASNPALHKLALARLTSPKSAPESIRTVEGFKKATANLPKNLVYFSYTDSKTQFKQIMLTLQGMWPMVNMVAAKAEIKLPVMFPSLTGIVEDMGPSCQYSWFDGKGLHSMYRGSGIEVSAASLAGGAAGVAIALPAIARARQIAKRLLSGTNLSGIGKACVIYAYDYDDKLPPNLEELIEKCELSPKSLESPRKPKDFDGPSYIYITGQTMASEPDNIVAYENPAFLSDGTNVLYMDCHVAFVKPDQFLRDLEETYKRLGREMPEIKFKDNAD